MQTVAGCGAFGDPGTHMLDILIWMLAEVTSVTATLSGGTGRYGDCDETGDPLLRFPNGAIPALAAGWTDRRPGALVISGTQGYAYLHGEHLDVESAQIKGTDLKQPWMALPRHEPAGFLRHSWMRCKANRPSWCTPKSRLLQASDAGDV